MTVSVFEFVWYALSHACASARGALLFLSRTLYAIGIQQLGGRNDWWFQGRELFEALVIRLAAHDGAQQEARTRFHRAVERLEPLDIYAGAWVVADCAAEIAEQDPSVWDAVERMTSHPAVREFVPLSARFTALRDMAERLAATKLRIGETPESGL